MTICDRCVDPGSCCREIRLSHKVAAITKLEVLAWLASCLPGSNEIGLPFIPEYQGQFFNYDGLDPCPFPVDWVYSCINLTSDGRCGDYENRPNLCRIFRAGIHKPCSMHHYPCPSFDTGEKVWQPPEDEIKLKELVA